ncbi:MAG: carboxypeptidase regulatory-like domain-containing protein [Acidobacteriia bacterium]|nr:carboxypeptidase regulatory-like domain-containing protein [Terriglobia bacterium]
MRRIFSASLLVVSLSVSVLAQAAKPTTSNVSESSPTRLPVRRVVLYKNGVGYFEHTGRVRGNQELSLDFTSAQLNDVLKSLTVVDLGEGRVTGVRYDSVAPIGERLKSLRLPFGEQTTRAEFLGALRGTRIEVRSGSGGAAGRLVSVEQRKRVSPKGELQEEVTDIGVITDTGELRTFELNPATSVRVADRDLNEEIRRYLNVIGSARGQGARRMVISTAGAGERDVFISYISEVPVWKSTYRIVLRKKTEAKPLLQGWAIVDNTVGEDWKDVQLSLVAGAPQSFIQEISQPYYVRRPVVALPENVSQTPQTYEATMNMNAPALPPPPPIGGPVGGGVGGGVGSGSGGGIGPGYGGGIGRGVSLYGNVTDPSGAAISNANVTITNNATGTSQTVRTDSNGAYSFFGAAPGRYTVTVNSPGFRPYQSNVNLGGGSVNSNAVLNVGSAMETVTVSAQPANLDTAIEALESEASASPTGDLFQYDIQHKITIGKNQSALVPIISARVDAEKVSIWNSSRERADRALWLTNSSGLTLDAGTFSVVEDGTFAGEGLIAALKPSERRLISYASDTAVRVHSTDDFDNKKVSRVVVAKGIMRITREEQSSETYVVRNSDTSPRTVVIEHPARDGWKLAEDLKPEESTASYHRFLVKVEAGNTAKLTVKEHHPDSTTLALSNLNSSQVELLVREGAVKPELEQAFRRILDKKSEISGFENELRSDQQEMDSIAADQGRVRENMKALKGTAEEKTLLQRYTGQLNAQEDRLAELRKLMKELRSKREAAGAELDKMILQISFDQTS